MLRINIELEALQDKIFDFHFAKTEIPVIEKIKFRSTVHIYKCNTILEI